MYNHWHHYSCSWSPVCEHNIHFEVAVVMVYLLFGGGGGGIVLTYFSVLIFILWCEMGIICCLTVVKEPGIGGGRFELGILMTGIIIIILSMVQRRTDRLISNRGINYLRIKQ